MPRRGGAGLVLACAAAFFPAAAVRADQSTVSLACPRHEFSDVEAMLRREYRRALRAGGPWGRRAAAALDAKAPARFVVATPLKKVDLLPYSVGISADAVMACCRGDAILINHDYLHSWSWNEELLVSSAPARARFVDLTAAAAVHEAFHYEHAALFGQTPRNRAAIEEELAAAYAAALFTLDRARIRPETLDDAAADRRIARLLRLERLQEGLTAEMRAFDAVREPTDAQRERRDRVSRWLNAFGQRAHELGTALAAEPGKAGLFWLQLGRLARSNEAFERALRRDYGDMPALDAARLKPGEREFLSSRLDEMRREADRRRGTDADLFARFANL